MAREQGGLMTLDMLVGIAIGASAMLALIIILRLDIFDDKLADRAASRREIRRDRRRNIADIRQAQMRAPVRLRVVGKEIEPACPGFDDEAS